jgi:hypothetical protein
MLQSAAGLRWLRDQRLLIHFQIVDLLYWSIVDVIDSILAELGERELFGFHLLLKDSLYTILRDDVSGTAEMLGRYNYPDVGRENGVRFIDEIRDLTTACGELLGDFDRQMLLGVLKMARGLKTLPYLENKTPNVLIDGFGGFVASRLWLFKNSQHILDQEPHVEKYLASAGFRDGDRPLAKWRFADSKHEGGIQVSDLATGLLGKLFTYFNNVDVEQIRIDATAFSDIQRTAFRSLKALIDDSIDECPGFANYVNSMEDRRRAHFMFEKLSI